MTKADAEYELYLKTFATAGRPQQGFAYEFTQMVAFDDIMAGRDPRDRDSFGLALLKMRMGTPDEDKTRRPFTLQPELIPLAVEWGASPVAVELLRRLDLQIAGALAHSKRNCDDCGQRLPNVDPETVGHQLGMHDAFKAARDFVINCRDGNAVAETLAPPTAPVLP